MFRSLSKTIQILNKPRFNFNRYYGERFNFELKIDPDTCVQESRVLSLVEHYRKYGHNFSTIDPLNLNKNSQTFPDANQFGLKYQEQVQEHLQSHNFSTHLSKNTNIVNVDHLESTLKGIYANNVGVEFAHLLNKEEQNWLYQNFERVMLEDLAPSEKLNIHQLLIQTEALDHFLHKKYSTFKRYAMEGAESMIIGLRNILAKASEKGVKEVVLGMPHRGRLNVLVNLLDYPARDLFYKISGNNDLPEELYTGVDDVVSHVSVSNKKIFRTGGSSKEKEISVTMLHNPSHLEAVNPVSMGKTKAKQDDNRSSENILNVQLHGDAAFSGQGIVFETFAMIKTPKFTVDGTVHMVVNNQIGYTTTPRDGRSSKYCTDMAKTFDVPVIHVNADDPEAVHRVSKLAVEFRQTFKKEIIIDLIAYRRFGHNEVDEPEFTQPQMYKIIRSPKKTSPELYHEKLIGEGLVNLADYTKIREKVFAYLEKEFEESGKIKKSISSYKNPDSKGSKTLTGKWKNMDFSIYGKEEATGLPQKYLKELSLASVVLPPSFTPHPRLKKFFIDDRIKSTEQNSIDWPTAEAIAAMSLIDEGYNVRLSGEDVERGTFSQRHWVFVDQKNESEYSPIKEFSSNKGRFQVYNSILSENAVLSYEYGYSLENPHNLVIWEAQFGDFFNPAQAVFDTFITCSEEKWLRQSGLVVLLPHGFDGAGPEHSSIRMERFLLHSSSDGGVRGLNYNSHNPNRPRLNIDDTFFYENPQDINFHLVQPTTPANFFHMLRRQMKRNFRKPLIVASAKTLLRSPNAKSSFEEMAEGTTFQPVITYPNAPSQDKSLIILCSGKVRYEIQALMKENEAFSRKTGLIVLEELMPFPFEELTQVLKNASKSSKIVWVQEEPSNSGAYFYVEPRIEKILSNLGIKTNISYCGRRSTAVTAIGNTKSHKQEVSQLANAILKL